MKMPPRTTLRHQAGMSLVEVMVAILVLSFGLIGIVGLQARATQYSMGAEDTNRAALLANEIVSAMWTARTVNLPAATVTGWTTRLGDTTNGGLPSGDGTVTVAGGVATVTVTWRTPSAAAGTPDHRYQTQVVVP
jgi:type IV pilus assembly protein PilV